MNRREIDEMEAALAAYTPRLPTGCRSTRSRMPTSRVLPLLDQARALPHGYDRGKDDGFSWLHLGLSQRGKLAAGAHSVYRHALERVLLPRLIWRLEEQMRGAIDRPDYLYEATRVYLMLGGEGRSIAISFAPGCRSIGKPPIPAR